MWPTLFSFTEGRPRFGGPPLCGLKDGSPRSPACEGAVDEQQDERTDDGRKPGAPIEELVDRVAEAERLGHESAHERAKNADDRRDDDAARVVSREDGLGDCACQEPENDPTDDPHVNTPFCSVRFQRRRAPRSCVLADGIRPGIPNAAGGGSPPSGTGSRRLPEAASSLRSQYCRSSTPYVVSAYTTIRFSVIMRMLASG